MARPDRPRIAIRRSGQDVALGELQVALRTACVALRRAYHALAPFTFAPVSGTRSGPRSSTPHARSRLIVGSSEGTADG